ncbi:MAG: hypothetical protein II625_09845 [Bacilli bacterium]|nr:hypothetical protein [Bacilli bacterium]
MMKELIKNIIDHKNSNDPKVCFFLMEYLKNNEVESAEDLKTLEDKYFTILDPSGDKKLTDLEIVERLYEDYENDYDDYMSCSVDNKKELDKLNEEFLTTDDLEKKFINLIKMYTILDWDLALPYHTYNYILEDKL